MTRKFSPYIRISVALLLISFVSNFAPHVFSFFSQNGDSALLLTFFGIALIFALSFTVFYLSLGTPIPSFVMAIFFGIAAQPLFGPIVHNHTILGALVSFGATLILFGGGLETPFGNFRKLALKIASLSFLGLFLTAFLFSLVVLFIGNLFQLNIPIVVAVLLGAVLASTDPAAIIPILKQLRFFNRDTKDIIVSESAMTDVTGTLLTIAFISLIAVGGTLMSVGDWYQALFTAETGMMLAKQILYGVLFGVIGYFLLVGLARLKKKDERESGADTAYFFFVPVIVFTITMAFGGSGYLAVFVAGLLFMMSDHLHDTERFFNQSIDGFLKPMIFLLLGALVDIQNLITYAAVGILSALVFMFVIRPLAVFLTLGPFSFIRKGRLTWKDLLFISFIRETGAIPAVLLVTIVSMGFSNLDGLVAIGMWVILATLIIQPPLTPLMARLLKVGTEITDEEAIRLNGHGESFVILGSRGHSYLERLPRVEAWAEQHNVNRIMLLHCLEDHYTSELAARMGEEAEEEFKKINAEREKESKKPFQFSYISRKGFLQRNIEDIAKTHSNLALAFVGRKVLDYRLSEVRQLSVPLYFLD